MSSTRETFNLLGQIRVVVDDTVDFVTEELIRSWAYTWTSVLKDWETAVAELQQLSVDGKWPPRRTVLRAERAQKALEATYQGLTSLGETAGVRIIAGLNPAIQAAQGHLDVIASQAPAVERAYLRASLVRADSEQIRAITTRVTEQITKTVFPLAGDSFEIMRETLVRGVAQGQNPRTAARRMVQNLHIGYSQSLTRAMTIARTEILDAHRAAAAVHHAANADVLQGWEWIATLDRRTCPSCLAQHGTFHELNEPGPEDHQQGRCARLPKLKSWAELGFNVEEPPSLLPDAQDWFDRQPDQTRVAIMGRKRLQLLDNGDVTWSDLSTRRSNPGWRDSHVVTPVKDLTSAS